MREGFGSGVEMNLLIYCAGGFGREVMDLARRIDSAYARWETISFIDDMREEPSYYGTEVFRFEAALERFGAAGMQSVIAAGEPYVRKILSKKLKVANVGLATLVDTSAVI
jgi:hypothetical protein